MYLDKYVDQKDLAARLAVRMSAGVALDVILWNPLHTGNKACKREDPPRADITRSPKQGYQWHHKKDWKPNEDS